MRATISFETDVDQVDDIMAVVVKKESDNIRSAAHILETTKTHELEAKLGESLEALYRVAHQLEQYKSMMGSFARAKLESSMTPPVDEKTDSVNSMRQVFEAAQNMKKFDSFIESINQSQQEEDIDEKPQEG